MGKVIVGTTMSLDGFINDRTGSLAPLYPDLARLRETDMLQESMESTGAVLMGRHAYDLADGDFTGYEYQVPIFVLTHHPPPNRKMSRSSVGRVPPGNASTPGCLMSFTSGSCPSCLAAVCVFSKTPL